MSLLLRYNLETEGYDVETVARGDDAEDDTLLRGYQRIGDWTGIVWPGPFDDHGGGRMHLMDRDHGIYWRLKG